MSTREAVAMSERTIVLVYDGTDQKHAETSVMDDPHAAARLVETMLEAGFEQGRIRIFTGTEMEMQVTHRPVVALVNGDAPGETQEKAIDAPADNEADTEQALPRAKAEREEAGVSAIAGMKDGVRFSSLFRTA